MSSLFNKLELQAFRAGVTPRTRESRAWFQKKAADLRRIDRKALMSEDPLKKTGSEIVGHMYMYFYEAKNKDTLPYYDKFPLTIVAGPAEGGFYGLNLHYLPPVLRAKFLDSLLDVTNNSRYDETTKFNLSYKMLKRASKMKYFAPCFKHYLNSQVRSQFAKVSAPEYEIAVFLPTAQWSGATKNKVYSDSRKML
tara:strand:- start:2944 stop:3528 length:585 start_codon:yes stop_codon:yes gene_type:complete